MNILCMNNFFFIFLLYFSCNAQEKKIVFCDISSKETIENVHVVSKDNVYISNNEGNVFLSSRLNDLLKASHLSYNDNCFFLKDTQDTLFLRPKDIILNEVIIKGNKVKTKKIFPKKDVNHYYTKNWGKSPPIDKKLSLAIFFPNEDKSRKQVIKKILVATSDYQIYDFNKNESIKMKGAKYSPFKVNLYSVDSINFKPKEMIFENDFIIQLEKNKEYAELKINEEFNLPNDGIFIVISNLEKNELEQLGYNGYPGIDTIGISDKNINFPFKRNNAIKGDWSLDTFLYERKITYNIGVELQVYE
jgi:hypothetical protein